MRISRHLGVVLVVGLLVVACGGNGDTTSDGATSDADSSDSGSASGDVVDVQPAGQAHVSVDGEEWTFDLPAQGDCILESDTITFGFLMSDTANTIAGGANLTDDGWLGDIRTTVINDELQPVNYYPADGAMDNGITIDGGSMSFSGPMLMKPPNDGTNPPAEDVGEGTISVTCG